LIMNNFEKELIQFIQTLEPQMAEQLTQWVEWEKELSWSNGYADAVDHYEYGIVNLVGEA
jgi:hypothetical protein